MKFENLVLITFGIILIGTLINFTSGNFIAYNQIPYRGESCETIDFGTFNYQMDNVTDYLRATKAYDKYTYNIHLKGYCVNGTRVGGLIK